MNSPLLLYLHTPRNMLAMNSGLDGWRGGGEGDEPMRQSIFIAISRIDCIYTNMVQNFQTGSKFPFTQNSVGLLEGAQLHAQVLPIP